MPELVPRRLWPATITMLALLLLTGLVWARVLTRDSGAQASGRGCPTPSPTFTSTLPDPSTVTIHVLNSTQTAGLATATRLALENDGFLSPRPAADDPARAVVKGVAEIRYGSAAERGARLLAYYLPGATLVRQDTASTTITVSLGRRFRRVAPQSSVDKQLSTAKVGLVKPAHPLPSGAAATNSPSVLPSNIVVAPIAPTAPKTC